MDVEYEMDVVIQILSNVTVFSYFYTMCLIWKL